MKHIQILISLSIALAACLLLSGCFKERVDLDLNQGENVKLAVEAWITDLDKRQTITLSLTTDFLAEYQPSFVDDAAVSIIYDNQEISFTSQGLGVYAMPENWRAETDKNYTLKINHNDTEYTSTSFMRPMPKLENIRTEFYEERDSIDYFDIFFSFQETAGEGDGYFAVDYPKGNPEWDMTTGGFTNDQFGDGVYFSNVTVTNEGYKIGDVVILETHSIGIDASDFLQDILSEVYREGLFDPPPVNIRSNISNGAVGFFITSGAERFEVIVKE